MFFVDTVVSIVEQLPSHLSHLSMEVICVDDSMPGWIPDTTKFNFHRFKDIQRLKDIQ